MVSLRVTGTVKLNKTLSRSYKLDNEPFVKWLVEFPSTDSLVYNLYWIYRVLKKGYFITMFKFRTQFKESIEEIV